MIIGSPSNPLQRTQENVAAAAVAPRQSIIDTPYDPSKRRGFFAAGAAAAQRENVLFSVAHELADGDSATAEELRNGIQSFNPYTHLRQTFDAEQLDKISGAISNGAFNEAVSGRQVEAIVDDLLYEQELQEQMESSIWGALAGSLLTAAVDPTSYIPFLGATAKLSRMGRIALTGFNVGLSTSVSEVALQASQRSRSLSESIMNVGTGSLLGGGIGMFAAGTSRASRLHPSHPENPLHDVNLGRSGETHRTLDGRRDVLSADEIDDLGRLAGGDSAGAARVQGTADVVPTLAEWSPKGRIGRAVKSVDKVINSQTVAGRLARASSDTARLVGLRMMDYGNVLMKANLRGEATSLSAEAIKHNYMVDSANLLQRLEVATNNLNAELGKAGKFMRGKIQHQDLMTATQRSLYGMEDKELDSFLVNKYGQDAADKIKAVAKENAEDIHETNELFEQRLLKEGLLQDEPLAKKLEGEVKALRAEIETMQSQSTLGGAMAKDTLAAELKQKQLLRDSKAEQLAAEKAKPKALGRDYGHAQLWNKDSLIEAPEDFKLFLMEVLAPKIDEEWLAKYYKIAPNELEDLRTSDNAKYREILSDWAGDEYYFDIAKKELEVKAAEEVDTQAKLDLRHALTSIGEAQRFEKSVDIHEAKTATAAHQAKLDEQRTRRDAVISELKTLSTAAEAARRQTLDRQLQEGQTGLEVRRDAANAKAVDQRNKARLSLEDVATSPNTPLDVNGQIRLMQDGTTLKQIAEEGKANAKVVDLEARNRQDADNVSVQTARTQGRAEALGEELKRLDAELAVAEAKHQRLRETLNVAERSQVAAKRHRQELTRIVKDARDARKITARDLKGVKKALRKAKRAPGFEEVVNDVYENLTRTGSLSGNIVDRLGQESERVTGRVKERSLVLDKETRAEAIKRGWLRDDLDLILHNQYDQISAELAIREALQIGPGRKYKSYSEVMKTVSDDYDQMIADATDKGLKEKLRGEKAVILDDINEGRNRLKGNYEADGTTNGWFKWGSSKLRGLNLMRYGATFLLSSLTDVATIALRTGVTDFLRYSAPAFRELVKMHKESPTEFMSMIHAAEMGMGAAASLRRYGSEDLVHGLNANYGVGRGNTRKVTGLIDRGFEKTASAVVTVSGVPVWNRFAKTVAGLAMRDKLIRSAEAYDSLKPKDIADLASLGVGRKEALAISDMLKKHKRVDGEGRLDPGLENWEDLEAVRRFRIAIQRDMNLAINTPGIGDTPRLMSTWQGKLLLQFQTFSFTFMNRFAGPVGQRMRLFNDPQAYMAMGILMMSAMSVVMLRDLRNGRDPMDRFKSENTTSTIHELIDQSGLLGWMSPYVDSTLKLTSPITGYGGNSRYARNNWADSLLGVNFGLFSDVTRAGSAVASWDDKMAEKLLTIAPFGSAFRTLNNLFIK